MTNDLMQLLRDTVADKGQAAVARDLGYSSSAMSQILGGTYRGSLDNFLQRVAEVYSGGLVLCPIMGEITLRRCAAERKKPFGAVNPQRVRLFRACQDCTAHLRVGAGFKPALF